MAKYQLLLPKMGESVAEATITKWLKGVGDHIEADDAVLEIATDKVDSEVPSPVTGKLIQQFFNEDDVVQVGAVLAIIETAEPAPQPQQPIPSILSAPPGYTAPAPVAPPVQQPPVPVHTIPGVEQLPPQVPPAQTPPPVSPLSDVVYPDRFYSPLVKSIASQEGIKSAELDRIPGTGADGRLTKDDLLNYISKRGAAPYQAPVASAAPQPVPVPQPVVHTPPPPAPAPQPEYTPPPVESVPEPVVPPQPPVDYAPEPEVVTPPIVIPVSHPIPSFVPVVEPPAPQPAPFVYEPPVYSPASIAPAEEKVPAEGTISTPIVEDVAPAAQAAEEPVTPATPPTSEPIAAAEPPAPESAKAEPAKDEARPVAPKMQPGERAKAYSPSGMDEIIEMDRMRRIISDHMVMSKHTSAHVTSFVEVDVTILVQWREKIRQNFENRERERITFTPIFIEAVVKAIKDMPMINVSVNGKQIIKKKDINIGMATALPSGNLIVPVIHKADELSLTGLTKAVNDLAIRARTNKLLPDEVRNGTFTITNVGSFGNVMGTPIINQPQVAILAIGVIKKKPAVIETKEGDAIAIRHMMFLSLSYDHRVVDGALGGSFVRRVADYLENWDYNREI